MRLLPDRETVSASVVGLGYVGSCVAAILADRGIDVTGIDTDPLLLEELQEGYCRFNEKGLPELLEKGRASGRLTISGDHTTATSTDVVIITVGTPIDGDGRMAEEQLLGACEALSSTVRPGQLYIFKSTVPPGTTRNLVIPILERSGLECGRDFGVAFCPERLSEGTAIAELLSLPLVVGGSCAESREAADAFWQRGLGVRTLPCASLETAEMVKLADNWWIDHNIALANELAQFCHALGVDVLEVIAAANTIPKGNGNVNILLPSVGVGGSCLPKDPWMLWRSGQGLGVDLRSVPAARETNDSMPQFTLGLVVDGLARSGKDIAGSRVAVLGLAFKNNTGDLRATPTEPVVSGLRAAGVQVRVHDPLADARAVEELFGVRPEDSVREAVEGADCVAILAWHEAFESIDLPGLARYTSDGCLLVDGRAYFSRNTIDELQESGFTYHGIGR